MLSGVSKTSGRLEYCFRGSSASCTLSVKLLTFEPCASPSLHRSTRNRQPCGRQVQRSPDSRTLRQENARPDADATALRNVLRSVSRDCGGYPWSSRGPQGASIPELLTMLLKGTMELHKDHLAAFYFRVEEKDERDVGQAVP